MYLLTFEKVQQIDEHKVCLDAVLDEHGREMLDIPGVCVCVRVCVCACVRVCVSFFYLPDVPVASL